MLSWLVAIFALQTWCSAPIQARQISFPRPDFSSSISVDSDQVTRWQVGQYEVLHLVGNIRIHQQQVTATANEAILWVETPDESPNHQYKIITYLEGQVVIDVSREGAAHDATGASADRIVDKVWLGRFFTAGTVDLNQVARPLENGPPPIFARAQAALENPDPSAVRQAGFVEPQQSLVVSPQTGIVQQVSPVFQAPQMGSPFGAPVPDLDTQNFDPAPGTDLSGGPGFATPESQPSPFKIRITGRDASVAPNFKSFVNPNNPNERVIIWVGGIRIVLDSEQISNAPQFQGDRDPKLYILANNIVNWQTVMPDGSRKDQFYCEGDVVFSKGTRVIYAERMFYDVGAQQGTILKAELVTTVPDYRGAVRLKAGMIQQYDENNLKAFGSAFTSSRMGVPRYWLQSETVGLQRTQIPILDPYTSEPIVDPQTGLFQTEDEYIADGKKNRVYAGGVPVFAWPRIKTSLNDPTLYLDSLGINNDTVFGFQLTTAWDLNQLLGRPRTPRGKRWVGVVDYLSERGVGVGTEAEYGWDSLFNLPGSANGIYRSWFINDSGLDNLGSDRRDLVPEENPRGRVFLNHRRDFYPGTSLRAEIGYISDRNFLEQYYELEWDTWKDQTTGFWLENNVGTRSNNIIGDLQINDFFTQTSGLQLERFVLGQPVFNNRAIWFQSSQVGYVRMREASEPLNPSEIAKFDRLAWEADVDGFRVGTRQELDFPTQVGPVKVVPYLLGDATYWQEDLNGNDLTRVYGQVGVRASLPFWRVDPAIQSTLWNVNGLAHKVTFDMDAFWSDSSQDLSDLPLYDQIDDDSQEHFRRRFAFNTYGIPPNGGFVPFRYDERNFAFRSGMQGNVTGPTEIADDLAAVQLGVRQRWQTKRGMPGRERIIDWITLDAQTTLFPNADRDNFGATFGMLDYGFRWHVGDRFSVVSDGYFDFFSQGLRTASFGGNLGRPEVGSLYLGFRTIEGPISSNILSAIMDYRMSDKWGVKAGGQVDFGAAGNIGQRVDLIYIGESFLWQFGLNYDVSRDNLGFRFGFEPRFSKQPKLFRPGGAAFGPAGSRWLE